MADDTDEEFDIVDFFSTNSTKYDVFFGFDSDGPLSVLPSFHADYLTKIATCSGMIASTRDMRESITTQGNGFSDEVDKKDDKEFFSFLKVTKKTFATLLKLMEENYTPVYRGGHVPITPKLCLQLGLRYLGHRKTTYDSIAEEFGLSSGCLFQSVKAALGVFCKLSENFIKWPKEDNVKDVENRFRKVAGFPGVIGVIDNCHIDIRTSKVLKAQFESNAKQSVYLMAVCDSQKKFTFIDVGFPGSAQGSDVFYSSKLYHLMRNFPKTLFPTEDYHLVGDGSFQLDEHIMVPYSEYNYLGDVNLNFNMKLSQTRSIIENSFAQLKARFARLEYIDAAYSRVPDIIKACCVLHNITLDNPEEEIYLRLEVEGHIDVELAEYLSKPANIIFVDPNDKRNYIASVMQ